MSVLETSLSRPHQRRILGGQEEENMFLVPGDHLKLRFLEFTKVEFWACQEAQNDF